MKHSIYTDQLVLEFWKGKIDVTDCWILSFIADLNPQDKALQKAMYRGHFLVTRKWILEQMPMLQISEKSIYRRLKKLKDLGILSCLHKTVDGNKRLAYFKMSDLYFKIHAKRHAKATEAAKKVRAVVSGDHGTEDQKAIPTSVHGKVKSHGHSRPEPYPPVSINASIKDAVTSPSPGGSSNPPPAEVEGKNIPEDQFHYQMMLLWQDKKDGAAPIQFRKHRRWLEQNAPHLLDTKSV